MALGNTGSATNIMEYITIASTGNSTDFGDTTEARFGMGGFSSPTRGILSGGNSGSRVNTIDYVTIASAGNATDFGDLLAVNSRGEVLAPEGYI